MIVRAIVIITQEAEEQNCNKNVIIDHYEIVDNIDDPCFH